MSETPAPYITAQPFAAGETVYHIKRGKGIVEIYPELPDPSPIWLDGVNGFYGPVQPADLSRTPWEPATPTQGLPGGMVRTDTGINCLAGCKPWMDYSDPYAPTLRHQRTCSLARTQQPAPAPPADDRDRLIADLRAEVAIYGAALDALDKASDHLPGYEGMRGFVGVENDDDGVQCLVRCEHDWHSDGKTITYEHAADCPLDAAFKAREARKQL